MEYIPTLTNFEWIPFIPFIPCIVIFVLILLSYLCKVIIFEDEIILYCLGISIRKLSVQNIRLICSVGNGREDLICISEYTTDDLAVLGERYLSKSFFRSGEVQFIKKKNNFKDIFAKSYLNRLRRNLFSFFQDEKVLFIPMNSIIVYKILRLFPHLPYKNYTGIPEKNPDSFYDESIVPFYHINGDIIEDEIIIRSNNKIKRIISIDTIKVIVRVDIFTQYQKNTPHHRAFLYLSQRKVEEIENKLKLQEGDKVLDVYRFAENEVKHWTLKKSDSCILSYSPELAEKLYDRCKNAHWIDISDKWLYDRI